MRKGFDTRDNVRQAARLSGNTEMSCRSLWHEQDGMLCYICREPHRHHLFDFIFLEFRRRLRIDNFRLRRLQLDFLEIDNFRHRRRTQWMDEARSAHDVVRRPQ